MRWIDWIPGLAWLIAAIVTRWPSRPKALPPASVTPRRRRKRRKRAEPIAIPPKVAGPYREAPERVAEPEPVPIPDPVHVWQREDAHDRGRAVGPLVAALRAARPVDPEPELLRNANLRTSYICTLMLHGVPLAETLNLSTEELRDRVAELDRFDRY